jgi:hypothetical protein
MMATRSLICTTILLVLISTGVRGQALNPDFLKCTVYVSFNPTPTTILSGTGFLVGRELDAQNSQIFLVTNKHVLPNEGKPQSITIRVAAPVGSVNKVQEINIPITGPNGKYLPTVLRHKDPAVDVAAIHITEQVINYKVPGKWLSYSLFVTKEKLIQENITVGDEVFLLGYPNAIYDPRNVSPILRIGTIATIPSEGYAFNDMLKNSYLLPDSMDGFLIDANVFPGSSGSLVILKQQSTTIGAQGETVVSGAKKIPYLLGIVSKSIPIDDTALGSWQRMGLGVVYSATTVKETIEQFYSTGNPHP